MENKPTIASTQPLGLEIRNGTEKMEKLKKTNEKQTLCKIQIILFNYWGFLTSDYKQKLDEDICYIRISRNV